MHNIRMLLVFEYAYVMRQPLQDRIEFSLLYNLSQRVFMSSMNQNPIIESLE